MNYQIIKDEIKLREFIDWLPELCENERYFLSLFARKKYCENIVHSSDKSNLKRLVTTKEKIFEKIKQLECEFGSYTIRNIPIPQDGLVLYINPNPRNMKKATFDMIKKCNNMIQNVNNGFNIDHESLSCIQRSKGTVYFCDFDIDSKEIDLTKLENILPSECYDIIETRGGYHVLVKTKTVPKNIKWFNEIKNIYSIDKSGDQFIPVCGCTQGGFVPKFIK